MSFLSKFLFASACTFAAGAAVSLPPAEVQQGREQAEAAAEAVAAQEAWARVAGPELAARNDARSAFFAAIVDFDGWMPPRDGTPSTTFMREQLERAATLGRDDALTQWMIAEFCGRKRCSRAEAAKRLTELEPTNAAAWHMTLPGADTGAVDAVLTHMADAGRYEVPYPAMTVAARDVFASLAHKPDLPEAREMPADAVSLALAIGYVTAFVTEPFETVTAACSPNDARYPVRRERCRRIAEHLAASGTVAARFMGHTLLHRTAANDAERADAARRHARNMWVSEVGRELRLRSEPNDEAASEAAAVRMTLASLPEMRRGDTEVERLERLLLDNHASLDPPDDYVPASQLH